MPASRVCLGPAPGTRCPTRATITAGTRCPRCAPAAQHRKDQRRPLRRTAAETSRRRQAVDQHVATYGWWCPGHPPSGHQPHPSTDLTAHHVVSIPDALAAGLTYEQAEAGPLAVLCRSENSRVAQHTDANHADRAEARG